MLYHRDSQPVVCEIFQRVHGRPTFYPIYMLIYLKTDCRGTQNLIFVRGVQSSKKFDNPCSTRWPNDTSQKKSQDNPDSLDELL